MKENIILNSKQDISGYVVTVYVENLTARLLENREIEFVNADNEVIFTMTSPYMYDSAGELSEEIEVELIDRGDVCYIFMTPDADWLNDESRVYPITVDPQVTTSSERTNIIDNYVLEGSGVQNRNLDRLYIGKKSGARARAFVKFTNMPTLPSGATITAATMTLHITANTSTGNTAHAYMVNGADWSSSTITWANMPTASGTLATNVSHNNLTKYNIPCLAAVQTWYNGSTSGTNKNYGIMIRYSNESIADYNAVYSADHTTASQRPSIVITYQAPSNTVSVIEGSTYTLSSAGISGTITWASSNTSIATVSSTGKVTGVNAGNVTITASVGGVLQKTYIVYVRIPSGVYYIKNAASSYYLSAKDGGFSEGTTLVQTKKSSSTQTGLWQIWKITYLNYGKYSVRPLHNTRMGLSRPSGIMLSEIGLTDSYSIVSHAMWTIRHETAGYVFENDGLSNYALRSSSYSDKATVTAGAYTQSILQKWILEQASPTPDLLLYSLDTEEQLDSPRRGAPYGMTRTLADINLAYAFSATQTNSQTVTWTSSNTNVATVNSSSGIVTGVGFGETIITCSVTLNGTPYTETYTLVVSEIPISGSELEYEPEIWNASNVIGTANCYSYAFNSPQLEDHPGETSGNSLTEVSREAVLNGVYADAAALGFVFEEIEWDDYCATGSYKVALVLHPGKDFHWYRQNPDGSWSHKRGNTAVIDYDASNNTIDNPETANRNYSTVNYSEFIGFYRVTPLEFAYDATNRASSYQSDTSNTNYLSFKEQNVTNIGANAAVFQARTASKRGLDFVSKQHNLILANEVVTNHTPKNSVILSIYSSAAKHKHITLHTH